MNLFRNVTRRGWRKREPMDDILPSEDASITREAVKLLISEGVFTRADLLQTLGLPERDVCQMAGLGEHFFNDTQAKVIPLRVSNRK